MIRHLLSLLCLFLAALPLHAVEKALYAVEFSAENNSNIAKSQTETFNVTTDGFQCLVTGFDNESGDMVYAGFGNTSYIGKITSKSPLPQMINKVTLNLTSVDATQLYTIKLFRSDTPDIPDSYVLGMNFSSPEEEEEAARICMGEFPIAQGSQTVEIESPEENQYYIITFDFKNKAKKQSVTLTGRCIEFYTDVEEPEAPGEPEEVEMRMFEGVQAFEWAREINLTDAVACVDSAGEQVADPLTHVTFTISPKDESSFASNPKKYTEEYMTTPYDPSKPDVTPLSLLPDSDSWLYDFPRLGLRWKATLEYADNALTAKVPCSGIWTVTATIPDDDPDYRMEPVTADITVLPTFEGFRVNWLASYDGAIHFAEWDATGQHNGKYNQKNVRLDTDGFFYDIYYRILADDDLLASEENDDVKFRKVTPEEADYTLYAPTYDSATDTVKGINLSDAKGVSFAIAKNGVSTLDADPTGNGAGRTFEIKSDLVTGVKAPGTDPAVPEDATTEWYTLQGMRIAAPAAPGLYIEKRGNHTRKIHLR